MTLRTPPAPSQTRAPEIEAGVIEDARRRQRRERWGAAAVLTAIAAVIALGFTLSNNGPTQPGGARVQSRATGVGATTAIGVPGAHTTLLTWPAGKPVFGDLPGGGPGTTVRVARLDTGRSTVERIPQIAGGDFPYTLASVGRWLVFNSDHGVAAIRADLRGRMRVLGQAGWFVPGARGHVWLIPPDNLGVKPHTVRDVDVSTGAQAPPVTLPRGADVIQGTTRGLLLVARGPGRDRLKLWHPGAPPVTLAPLGFGAENVFTTTTNRVAYGSSCNLLSRPHGAELVCARLTVLDLQSGARRSVAAPTATRGWVAPLDTMRGSTSLSTNGRYLAAQAALPPAGGDRARLYLVRLRGTGPAATPVPNSTTGFYAQMAWSTSGDWLTYQTGQRRLKAWRPGAKPRTLTFRCCGATMVSVP